MSIIKRQTLSSAVANSLRERILTGELVDGTQLIQETLSQEYGISRVPIREALRQLEAEGLITFEDHKGAKVTQLHLSDVLEMIQIRALLEKELIQRAIPLLTQTHLEHAKTCLIEFNQAFEQNDIENWGRLNAQFHTSFYQVANRPHTLNLIQQLYNQTDRYTRMQILLTQTKELAHNEHQHILELCQEKQVQEAGEFIYQHILNAGEMLAKTLRNPTTI
ncbi:GntR family transcriptional regulator [Neisseria sp. Ec49-e6-T10]|uniref:GntR family transcriptional regulator n=1 Tax=Neisseria sp. Ec49-e6-T10 TaxID=3140744 RepID=UPI003EBABD43